MANFVYTIEELSAAGESIFRKKEAALEKLSKLETDLNAAIRYRDEYALGMLMDIESMPADKVKAYGTTVESRKHRIRLKNEDLYVRVEMLQAEKQQAEYDLKQIDSTIQHLQFQMKLHAIAVGTNIV